MIKSEAVVLISYLNRAGIVLAVEDQAVVWADALPDVSFGDAQMAARAIVRDRGGADRWVTPGDVRAAVRRLRLERLALCPDPLPAVDPDDVAAYQAERRRLLNAIASGAQPQIEGPHV